MAERKDAGWQVRVGSDHCVEDSDTVPVEQLSEAAVRLADEVLEASRGNDPYSNSTATPEPGKRPRRIDDMRKLDAEIKRARVLRKVSK
jgi:hypothetical protein